ncbi:MAG: CcoQ/FixQ family Cbb3-type cytochrome c oxidase assembly chaperone [Bacteroidota bacterium]
MKFINYLESISGIGIYPLISFLIFFTFFILLGIYVVKSDKKTMDELSRIPLENEPKNNNHESN